MSGTRKLGRATDCRRAMLRAMVTYLLENGKIETTVTRAKEVRAMAEKMITVAKNDDLHSKRQVFAFVTKEAVAKNTEGNTELPALFTAITVPGEDITSNNIGNLATVQIIVTAEAIQAEGFLDVDKAWEEFVA